MKTAFLYFLHKKYDRKLVKLHLVIVEILSLEDLLKLDSLYLITVF